MRKQKTKKVTVKQLLQAEIAGTNALLRYAAGKLADSQKQIDDLRIYLSASVTLGGVLVDRVDELDLEAEDWKTEADRAHVRRQDFAAGRVPVYDAARAFGRSLLWNLRWPKVPYAWKFWFHKTFPFQRRFQARRQRVSDQGVDLGTVLSPNLRYWQAVRWARGAEELVELAY
jgi:hypothetical protein